MTLTRRFSLPLRAIALLVTPAAAAAQDPSAPSDWVGSDEGHLFVRPNDPTVVTMIRVLEAES